MKLWVVIVESDYDATNVYAYKSKQGAISHVVKYFCSDVRDMITDYKSIKEDDFLDFILKLIDSIEVDITEEDKAIYIQNDTDFITIKEIEVEP